MTEQPEVLIPEEEIQKRVQALGAQISEDYKDVDDVYMLGVLRGAFIFLADLSRVLTVPRRASSPFRAVSTSSRSRATRAPRPRRRARSVSFSTCGHL